MSIFSKASTPLMAKALAVVVLIASTVIGLMAWNQSRMEKKMTDQIETIGIQAQFMAQQTQTITDIERDKAQLSAQQAASESVLGERLRTEQKSRHTEKLLRIEIGKLKHENAKLNDYLNIRLDPAIVQLFRQPPENSDCDKGAVCDAPTGTHDANAFAVYTNESLVHYILDLESAIDSCNADKASTLKIYKQYEALNSDD